MGVLSLHVCWPLHPQPPYAYAYATFWIVLLLPGRYYLKNSNQTYPGSKELGDFENNSTKNSREIFFAVLPRKNGLKKIPDIGKIFWKYI